IWDYIERKGLLVNGSLRAHDLVERLGEAEGGRFRVYEQGVSRALMRRIADALPDQFLADLGTSDVLSADVGAIQPKGEAPVSALSATSNEDRGPAAVADHAVLEVHAYGLGQHDGLDVPTTPLQSRGIVAM